MDHSRYHPTEAARRRREQIEDCLYQALLSAPWRSVSVADICRRAGISRKAFYKYYPNKEDCFGALVRHRILDAMLRLMDLPDGIRHEDYAIALLNYWKEQREFLDILVRDNLLSLAIFHSTQHTVQSDPSILDLLSFPSLPADLDILSCYLNCQFTLILNWYYRDFQDPVEEMAKKYLRITRQPLIADI